MLDRSEIFTDNQAREDAQTGTFVKLTDGVTTWYLGNIELDLVDPISIIDVGLKWGGAKQKIDILTKKPINSGGSILFSNLPYKKDSNGDDQQLSDVLTGILNKDVEIYLVKGNVKSLADCLLIFKGKIDKRPKFTDKQISIVVKDSSIDIHRLLPLTTVSGSYPNDLTNGEVYPDNFNKYPPIIYGSFNVNDFGEGTGLAPTTLLTTVRSTVASHPVFSLSGSWMNMRDDGIDEPVELPGSTLGTTGNMSGKTDHAYILLLHPAQGNYYFYPNQLIENCDNYGSGLTHPNAAVNPFNAIDKTSGSFATITQAFLPGHRT